MPYVDGFLVPVPKNKLAEYRRLARMCAKVWREHGALEFRECVSEDPAPKGMLGFARVAKLKPGETVMFSWIVFKSRAHRDRVNAKVMRDPRMKCPPDNMPFDVKRMAYGGFQVLVQG